MPNIKRLVLRTHYCVDDPEFWGDYTGVELLSGTVVLASYGDSYHDKGRERMDGFIAGLRAAGWNVEITEESVADFEC